MEQTNLQDYKPGLLTMVSDSNDGYAGSYFYIVIGSSGRWNNAFGMWILSSSRFEVHALRR